MNKIDFLSKIKNDCVNCEQLSLFDIIGGAHLEEENKIKKIKKDFKIVRLSEDDVKLFTDNILIFKAIISKNETMYPNILEWVNKKVIPGLKSKNRIAYIGFLDNKPIVSAVVKISEFTKFCHLRIHENLQEMHLGELFFSLMTFDARHKAKEIHFTLPESLWETKNNFFRSFGFDNAKIANIQYRLFDNELKCSAPFKKVWNLSLQKLQKISELYSVAGYSLNNRLLMSFHPKFADKIIEGKKNVEIRRKFSKKWEEHYINIYSAHPERALVGQALISKVEKGNPSYIWDKYNSDIGCDKKEYLKYVNNCDEIYALILKDIKPFRNKIFLTQLIYLIDKNLTPPQSYSILDNKTPWSKAVSIAALLHGSCRMPKNISF